MMRIVFKTILATTFCLNLLTHQVEAAYCARCVKIEEERAKEQTEHPQNWEYYDDQLSFREKDQPSPAQPSHQENKSLSEPHDLQKKTADHSSKESNEDKQLSMNIQESDSNMNQYIAENIPPSSVGLNQPFSSPQNVPFFEEDDSLLKADEEKIHQKLNLKENLASPLNSYSTLLTILKTKLFLETLDGSFTLFIPTNQALMQLSPQGLVNLIKPENQEQLAALVSNHIVAKKILKQDFESYKNREIKAISGKNLTIRSENGSLSIDNARILSVEPAGYDGVIYVIDRVLLP